MRSLVVFLGGGLCAVLVVWAMNAGKPPREADGGGGGGASPAAAETQAAGGMGAPTASPVGEPPAGETPPAPVVASRPVFFAGDASRAAPAEGTVPPPAVPAPAGPAPAPQTPPVAVPKPAASSPGGTAGLVPATAADDEARTMAISVFDTGDRRRGIRMLEALYAEQREKPQVDLSPEVERLLQVETRPERRREYLLYLGRFDKLGRVLEDQLASAKQKAEKADDDEAAARGAWDDFTLAYEIARDAADRARVMAALGPFLERHVFSGRHSALLRAHAVQPGESLFSVASKYETTVDSLRRLNGLKNDVIQPRMRLRVLEGKVKVFVDKSDFILWATVGDRLLFEYPVGLGKDNGTPARTFVVRVKQKDPPWWKPGAGTIPAGDRENVLGSRWLGFQETQELTGYGIHGTQDPASVGKESSAGCIRLRNEDVEKLYDFVPYGTEVAIRP